MEVKVEYDSGLKDDEICIRISPNCVNQENIIQILSDEVIDITGKIDEKIYLLSVDQIESFYTLGQNIFASSQGNEYKIKEKLYEIEKRYENKNFMRISKSTIVNIKMIDYISPSINRQLMFKMVSGEKLYSSRSYNSKIKERIGV